MPTVLVAPSEQIDSAFAAFGLQQVSGLNQGLIIGNLVAAVFLGVVQRLVGIVHYSRRESVFNERRIANTDRYLTDLRETMILDLLAKSL